MKGFLAFLATVTVAMVLGLSPASATEGFKWGYIDVPLAMRTVEKGKQAYDQLKTMKDKKQGELEKEEATLRNSTEQLKKQQNVLSQDALMRKNKELSQAQIDLQRKAENYEMELRQAQNEFAQKILTEIDALIKQIAEKEGYHVIFEKSGSNLLYAQSSNDLTQKLVTLYNQTYGTQLSKSKK